MTCEHHKLCGECFSPEVVSDLERRLASLTEAAQAAARRGTFCGVCKWLVIDCDNSSDRCAGTDLRRVLREAEG